MLELKQEIRAQPKKGHTQQPINKKNLKEKKKVDQIESDDEKRI